MHALSSQTLAGGGNATQHPFTAVSSVTTTTMPREAVIFAIDVDQETGAETHRPAAPGAAPPPVAPPQGNLQGVTRLDVLKQTAITIAQAKVCTTHDAW